MLFLNSQFCKLPTQLKIKITLTFLDTICTIIQILFNALDTVMCISTQLLSAGTEYDLESFIHDQTKFLLFAAVYSLDVRLHI